MHKNKFMHAQTMHNHQEKPVFRELSDQLQRAVAFAFLRSPLWDTYGDSVS
jgi:hypothetical protein